MNAKGEREIASHYYPLTGPYDSRDDNLLEYQVLLMKLSGVDGVIVDWYGIKDYNDYLVLHESTQALIYWIEEADMEFSICYEDRTIKAMVDDGHFTAARALNHGKEVMNFLGNNWFGKDFYTKLDGQPVLLSWGPVYFKSSSDWETMFAELEPKPHLFTYENRLAPIAIGAYPWPPMWKSKNGVLSPIDLNLYLTSFYQNSLNWDYLVATAFPGFHDIYEEAGLHNSYGYLDAADGETFRNTIATAMSYEPEILQVATWNDYGEGTIVEPTREFGYQYLDEIQNTRRTYIDSTFNYQPEFLEMPLKIYELRQEYSNSSAVQNMLDDAFYHIVDGNIQDAQDIVNSLYPQNIDAIDQQATFYKIGNFYPNPFNPVTTLKLHLSRSMPVKINIYDLQGNLVDTLANQRYQQGDHIVQWDAESFTSGVYFVKIFSEEFTASRKIVLMK